MNVFLIAVAILCSVLIWPVNRWVTHGGGRAPVYGFWLCLTGAVTSGLAAAAAGPSANPPVVWGVGLAIGVAFAIGFCLVVMYCLKIGPAGPTVVMNNMGMVWPVVLGALWLRPHPLNGLAVAGVGLVVAALIGFGFSQPGGSQGGAGDPPAARQASARWAAWAFVAWILSGISQTSQLVGSIAAPDSAAAITFAYNTTATLVLAPLAAREAWLARRAGQPAFNQRELIGGLANGAILVAGMVDVLTVLTQVGPEIVFPFTVAGPMIAELFRGQYVYRERLDRIGWIACGLGVAGLLALSISQG